MSQHPQERRKYDRYQTDVKIQFYVHFDLETKINYRVKDRESDRYSDECYEALSDNISVEGVAFSTDRRLEKEDQVLLDVFVPSSSDPIKMEGRVRWCRENPSGSSKKLYTAGLLLTTVNKEDVHKTVFFDEVHQVYWSAVLEAVFSSFKVLSAKRKEMLQDAQKGRQEEKGS